MNNLGGGNQERERAGPNHKNKVTGKCNHTLAECYSQGGGRPNKDGKDSKKRKADQQGGRGDHDSKKQRGQFTGTCHTCKEQGGHKQDACPLVAWALKNKPKKGELDMASVSAIRAQSPKADPGPAAATDDMLLDGAAGTANAYGEATVDGAEFEPVGEDGEFGSDNENFGDLYGDSASLEDDWSI